MGAYLPSDSQGSGDRYDTGSGGFCCSRLRSQPSLDCCSGSRRLCRRRNLDVAPTLKDQAGAVVGGGNSALVQRWWPRRRTLSLLLLIGAGLLVKSLERLRALGPGFPAERLIGFRVDPYDRLHAGARQGLLQEPVRIVEHSACRAGWGLRSSGFWRTTSGTTPRWWKDTHARGRSS